MWTKMKLETKNSSKQIANVQVSEVFINNLRKAIKEKHVNID